ELDFDFDEFEVKVKLKSLSEENTVSCRKHRCEEETPVSQEKPQFPVGNSSFPEETPVSYSERSPAETQTAQDFQNSKTIQTYSNFLKTLSERERERFLEFSRNAASRLNNPKVVLVEKWIADNHQWLYAEFEKIHSQESQHSGESQGSAPPQSDEKNELHPLVEAGLADGSIDRLDPAYNGLFDADGNWWKLDEWIEMTLNDGGNAKSPDRQNSNRANQSRLQIRQWIKQALNGNPDDKTPDPRPNSIGETLAQSILPTLQPQEV
ncbi:MAG: hypothetical protein SWY16_27220, partial [Cyanobacteriota bacterium]|nr:hypothetical protein [Cyanobacteriota bacterium]